MKKATEQRIKHKLKNISKELNIPFNLLLDTLFLERFLVRIGRSDHADKLVFKGGMCLAQFIQLGRETKDIDFLLCQVKGETSLVKQIIEEVSTTDVGDDFIFSEVHISELSIQHKKYPGYRLSVQAALGQIRNQVSIDIGVGDIVRPRALVIELLKSKEPLFEQSISLNSYPPEYIFSEKVEAILYLGELNSRMKDFYDCYRLIREDVLNKNFLKEAVLETMDNRETKLELIPESIEIFDLKWKPFLKKNKLGDLDLGIVIATINEVLSKIIKET